MILQAYFGENAVWSVIIFTAALTLNGAVTGGYLGNGLDIAPNFSGIYEHLLHICVNKIYLNSLRIGTIFGMANTLSSFGGFLSSYIVGKLTNNNVSLEIIKLKKYKNIINLNKVNL